MEKEVKKSATVLEVIKALVIAVIVSLALILVAALVIKLCNLKTEYIPVINQIIKGLSIVIGCVIAIKYKPNTWLKGIVVGILYIAVAFVIFSLLDGEFVFGLNILNDVALGGITGMISGILAGLKK